MSEAPPILVDTHCHLNFPEYDHDRADVVERARNAGVKRMVAIATHQESWKDVLALTQQFDDIWAALGLHPLEPSFLMPAQLSSALTPHLNNPKVVALGETGLDAYRASSEDLLQQRRFFEAHLNLAAQYHLPVVVHSRQAEEATLEALQPFQGKVSGVMHCFTGTLDFARKAIDLGFYISFSGILTFKSAKELQEVARQLPLERLVIETDAPFLCPKRGQRNEPCYVADVAKMLAHLQDRSYEDVCHITTKNAYHLFRWGEREQHP